MNVFMGPSWNRVLARVPAESVVRRTTHAVLRTLLHYGLVAGLAVAADAGRGVVHRASDRVAQQDGSSRDGGADDGEDQRVFGSRSTRLVLNHLDEVLHVT